MKINISKMNKAIVLMVLYNESKSQGNSFLGGNGADMNQEEATKRLESQTDFDYLNGKVMKINLKPDALETWLYDRDNGDGAALKAIQSVYPDAIAITEEEVIEDVVIKTEPLIVSKVQAKGRMERTGQTKPIYTYISTGKILKFKKRKTNKSVSKIEYSKGFFTVNGEIRKETKAKKAGRVIETVAALSDKFGKVKHESKKK